MTRLLRRFLRPYTGSVAVVVVLLLVQSIANLYLPNLNADIINEGVLRGDTGYIWRTGGVMLALTLGLSVIAGVAVYLASRTAMALGRDVRSTVFDRVQRLSAREMNRFGAPSLITRNTNDVQQVQLFVVMALTIMVSAPVMAVGGAIMALYENARLSLLLVVIIPLMAGVVGLLMIRGVPLFRTVQTRIDRINQVLREQITGVRVVRAFVRTESERRRFARANDDLTWTSLRVARIFTVAMPAIFAILNLSSVAVIWFGGHLVDAGDMLIGNLTAFLTYLLQILMSVMMAVMITIFIPRAAACAERIAEVIDLEPAVLETDAPVVPAARTGTVELRDVSFRYPGAEHAVLRGVSFTLHPGETTAIVGSTGSGKTTVVNLVARLFDVTDGAVLVDGVDVRRQPLEAVWGGIGLVPQRAYLFGGTVASNLRLGRADATDEELWQALEVAQARDFVAQMPGGLEEPVAQGGTNVSGGQRQRLSIARALVRRPRIYLFDDCFSALDAATEARLRLALRRHTGDATVLIVAQRVSTVLHADRILVLDEGEVAGAGTHHELMATSATYRDIVESQLPDAEAVS